MDSTKRGDDKTVTPDFEDWLARQEVPIEETLDIDAYQDYLIEQIGYRFPYLKEAPSAKQMAVVGKMWAEKYELLAPYNIRPVTYTYSTGPREGQRETRWVIAGEPGLWSYVSMREIWERITGEER